MLGFVKINFQECQNLYELNRNKIPDLGLSVYLHCLLVYINIGDQFTRIFFLLVACHYFAIKCMYILSYCSQ